MNRTIELRKRTPSEQEAYIQGLTAGIRMGAPMQTVLVLQIERFISPEDSMELRRAIEAQMKTGLVTLGPGIKFCGTVPEESDVEVLVKGIKEALKEQ